MNSRGIYNTKDSIKMKDVKYSIEFTTTTKFICANITTHYNGNDETINTILYEYFNNHEVCIFNIHNYIFQIKLPVDNEWSTLQRIALAKIEEMNKHMLKTYKNYETKTNSIPEPLTHQDILKLFGESDIT